MEPEKVGFGQEICGLKSVGPLGRASRIPQSIQCFRGPNTQKESLLLPNMSQMSLNSAMKSVK